MLLCVATRTSTNNEGAAAETKHITWLADQMQHHAATNHSGVMFHLGNSNRQVESQFSRAATGSVRGMTREANKTARKALKWVSSGRHALRTNDAWQLRSAKISFCKPVPRRDPQNQLKRLRLANADMPSHTSVFDRRRKMVATQVAPQSKPNWWLLQHAISSHVNASIKSNGALTHETNGQSSAQTHTHCFVALH